MAFQNIFSVYNKYILKKQFYKVHVSGNENILNRNKDIPTIIFGNHSNWWDGLIAFYLSFNLWKSDAYMMMDIKQMSKYKFFKWVGAFSINRESAAESYESVMYASKLLKDNNKIIWIFPQGEMLHNDLRPISFQNGLSKLLELTGKINLIPIVFSYEFLMEQRPEVFIKISPALTINENYSRKEKSVYLSELLTGLLDKQNNNIINKNTVGYNEVLRGKDSRNKTIDKIYND